MRPQWCKPIKQKEKPYEAFQEIRPQKKNHRAMLPERILHKLSFNRLVRESDDPLNHRASWEIVYYFGGTQS